MIINYCIYDGWMTEIAWGDLKTQLKEFFYFLMSIFCLKGQNDIT